MATIASMSVRLGIDTDQLQAGAERAKSALLGISKVVGGLGVGAPAIAASVTALAGLAAGAAAAGMAVGAFKAAVAPQMEAVAEVADLAAAAEEAAAEGGKKAAAATKAYKDALAELPPETQATAKAFMGLQKDYQKWSDSLSPKTMPVVTKGIQLLRSLLPTLTPLVTAAADAMSGFLDDVARGVKSAGFKQWAADMTGAAGPALSNFLAVIKNLAVGFGGLLAAFAPTSTAMTGGLVAMTEAFAQWGTSLKGSEGFAQFLDTAASGGQTLGNLAGAVVNLAVAMGPLIGTTTVLVNQLARIVASVPTPVLTVLASALVAVKVAMVTYAAASRAVAVANAVMSSSAVLAIAGWARMLAFGIATYTRLAAAAVASAARTAAAWIGSALTSIATWVAAVVRAAAVAVAQFVLMAARAVVWAAIMAAQWLIAMGPIGWIIAAVIGLAALIIVYWDQIKAWTMAVWDWIWNKIKQVAQLLINIFLNFSLVGLIIKHWTTIKTKTMSIWNAVVAWVRGLPGKLLSFFLNWTIVGRFLKHWQQIKDGTVRKGAELISWVRGLPGRITSALGNLGSLLLGAGRRLIQGLINGITGMIGNIKSTLGRITSMLPDWKGPARVDARILTPAGASLMEGFQSGISSQVPALRRQLQGITGDLPDMTVRAPRGVTRQSGAAAQRLVIDVTGADREMKDLMRRIVKVDGRGSVQTAFS